MTGPDEEIAPAGRPAVDADSGSQARYRGMSGARRLMARLRELMAGSGNAQDRLDKIVQVIAGEIGTEVCSCYLMRAGEVLELFATIGLNPSAVRRTRLRVGEGLVGDVAARMRPVALADARNHPSFAYRPETGEDPYASFCGVPILRGRQVRGVLVVQDAERREFSEEEIETLQTVAMVMAELIVTGDLVDDAELPAAGSTGLVPTRIDGLALNAGIAIGRAVRHRRQVVVREIVAENPAAELRRLHVAWSEMRAAIDTLVHDTRKTGHADSHDILEAYRMIADDQGWLGRIRGSILQGLTAEAAVTRAQAATRARLSRAHDPYLRERLNDLDDLSDRLLRHLAGNTIEAGQAALPDDMIVVARAIGPAQLLDYDRARLRGLVLEEGSPSSHVAIVARALDIPVVGRCAEALERIEPLDPLVVDGDAGVVYIRPNEVVASGAADAASRRAAARQRHLADARSPSVSLDGVAIDLLINAGLTLDMAALEETGAAGVGLYRTEVPFMVSDAYPDVGTQTRLYRDVLEAAGARPVTFRTLDIGGDKRLGFMDPGDEPNPALGWRAIRMGLDRPAMLRRQLRALIQASAGRPLNLMFPLVTEVAEFDAARRILDLELARADETGAAPPSGLKVGAMLEVPALLFQLPALFATVDFVAIGSNDLMQYLFAVDRDHPHLGNRYDPLSPPMLSALKAVIDAGETAGVPVSLCGEMAGRPIDAMALIGLGLTRLSMAPRNVGPVRAMIRSLDVSATRAYLGNLMNARDHSVRARLRGFAQDRSVVIEDVATAW